MNTQKHREDEVIICWGRCYNTKEWRVKYRAICGQVLSKQFRKFIMLEEKSSNPVTEKSLLSILQRSHHKRPSFLSPYFLPIKTVVYKKCREAYCSRSLARFTLKWHHTQCVMTSLTWIMAVTWNKSRKTLKCREVIMRSIKIMIGET